MDHLSRYPQAYVTHNKSAKTVADKLYNDYILRFGFPAEMQHDQGGEFENHLFQRLEQLCDSVGSPTPAQRHTTLKANAKWNGLTALSCPCCTRSLNSRNMNQLIRKLTLVHPKPNDIMIVEYVARCYNLNRIVFMFMEGHEFISF